MTDELKKKRHELATLFEHELLNPKPFTNSLNAYQVFSKGFDACHEIMQAKLDVAIEGLEYYSIPAKNIADTFDAMGFDMESFGVKAREALES